MLYDYRRRRSLPGDLVEPGGAAGNAERLGPNIVLLLANNVEADTDSHDHHRRILGRFRGRDPALTRATVAVTVREAPLVNSFTIVPDLADCGTAVCSGQTATAQVTLRGAQGGRIAGRAIRFDVIGTDYAIVTNNPAQPLASSLTVLTDVTGTAAVIIKANVNAPTQAAQMSVTDVTTGLQLVGNFTIVQITDGSQIMTVVPSDATITGAFKGICSTGFVTDYYIYGGTPPYRVTSTFPNSVVLVEFGREYQRRLLPGDHQRRVRRSADVLDRGRDRPPDDRDAAQRRGYGRDPAVTPEALAVAPTAHNGPRVYRQDVQFRHLRRHASVQRQHHARNRIPANRRHQRRLHDDQRLADRQRRNVRRDPGFELAAEERHRDDHLLVGGDWRVGPAVASTRRGYDARRRRVATGT